KSEYLRIVTQNFPLPALCKDFFLDEGQIYEAFYWGASAILLIVSILDDDTLKKFIETAGQLDMDCLVEVHDELELERALKAGAGIIGINNRDLHTFQVDLAVSRRLIPQIPSDKVIVSESGIGSHDYVKELGRLGAHAVLIGETFIRAQDVAQKIKEVMQGA
ncbi:MAG: indole-3-glycerol-phosphate synthase, partial [Candidatus Omnitrophica bacterium]|nr:indole-3-glycerol-phosphate synthase [Candidatus Omnitrophota bacterium]